MQGYDYDRLHEIPGLPGVSLPRGDTGLKRAGLPLFKKSNFYCSVKASGISRAYLLL